MIADRIAVRSTDFTYGRWVGEIGKVSGVRASWARQGGCDTASFSVRIPSRWGRGEIPLLRRGRGIEIYDGSVLLWAGRLTESVRADDVVSVTCKGWWEQAAEFASANTALDTVNTSVTTGVPGSVDVAVDNAIARGWQVTRVSSFNAAINPVAVEPLPDLLSRVGLWQVNELRQVLTYTAPSTATLMVQMITRPADTTSSEYLTDLVAKFLDAGAAGAVRYMRVSSGRTPRIERTVDLTGLGQIPALIDSGSQKAAYTLLAGVLGQVAPLPPAVTGAFTITSKGLLTLGQVTRPVSRLRPGTRLRLSGVQPSVTGTLNLTTSVELDVDQVDWEADTDTVNVTPVAGTPRDLNGILELAFKPVAETLEDFVS